MHDLSTYHFIAHSSFISRAKSEVPTTATTKTATTTTATTKPATTKTATTITVTTITVTTITTTATITATTKITTRAFCRWRWGGLYLWPSISDILLVEMSSFSSYLLLQQTFSTPKMYRPKFSLLVENHFQSNSGLKINSCLFPLKLLKGAYTQERGEGGSMTRSLDSFGYKLCLCIVYFVKISLKCIYFLNNFDMILAKTSLFKIVHE